MKKIVNILLAAVALFAFAPISRAQYTDNGNGICYSKTISEPDDSGIYTITLESFVTGAVTIESKNAPADIVLVLDYSGSMEKSYGTTTRIAALKSAVEDFIDEIYKNDNYDDEGNLREQALGNRIAVIVYSKNDNNSTTILKGLTYVTTNRTGSTIESRTKDTSINQVVQDRGTIAGGTYSNQAMVLANEVLAGIDAERKKESTRTVLLFTDGIPASENWGNNSPTVADQCIAQAYIAKHRHTATVFSVGLLSGLSTTDQTRVENYLNYTSSNYPDAEGWNDGTTTWNKTIGNKASDNYYKDAGEDLTSVFRDIASESGGSGNTSLSSAVTTVDVVSASFTLPENADESSIKVYTARCIGQSDETYTITVDGEEVTKHYLTFGEETLAPDSSDTVDGDAESDDVDNNIEVALTTSPGSTKKNMISVNGFDYSANWCGIDESATSGWHGHKIIIKIPIKMDPEAVGGPNVETNAEGSGIYTMIDDELTNIVEFKSPTVSLPVNLFIEKTGLKKGESAKFLVQRAILPDNWTKPSSSSDSAYDKLDWEDVTSVFVTQSGTDTPMTKVMGLPSTISQEINGETVQKELVYKVVEEKWAWSYTCTPLTAVTTDQLITNPFKFSNTPKADIDKKVRHAESKVTNTFKTGGGAKYDDSKSNNR